MANKVFLAIDLGASGGRVMAGLLDGISLRIEELHRFDNQPIRLGDNLHWDLPGLWIHVQDGLRKAADSFGNQIVSVGVDTWGVDYGLLSAGDEILGNPYSYRDRRTERIFERAFELVSRDEVFAETGLQFMQINTVYQLLAARLAGSPLLEMADLFLLMPDLFNWLLTGEKVNELTNATTTQLYNPRTGNWSAMLIERFGLPSEIFGTIVPAGRKLGKLRPHVAEETNLGGVEVVLPGTHDTASAVYAVPASDEISAEPTWCYLSSGTWSLVGVETPQPIINEDAARWNFTNEGGVGGTTRVLKNIAGLWLVQECRRIWQRQGQDFSWEDLVRQASAADPLRSLVNPDDPRLLAPDHMPAAIAKLCREANEPVPNSPGATVRCCLESLALRYRQVVGWLEKLMGRPIETIHVVGGGCRNSLLNQLTADACGRLVIAGPVEATAIGNVMVQAQTVGEVAGHAEARQMIRSSFPLEMFRPQDSDEEAWASAGERFERIVG